MNFHDLVSDFILDTTGKSLGLFLPELTLCVTVAVMLLVRLFRVGRWVDPFYIALAGSFFGLWLCAPWDGMKVERTEIFTGMLVYDPFTIYMRSVLFGFAGLFLLLSKFSGIPSRDEAPDIYTLVLGATLGMCLMASSNHLLMVFLSVEMASVPSYVLAGLLKGRRQSSEAALKYSVYGAGASGVMLYGLSLMSGLLNTAHLPTLATELAKSLPSMAPGQLMVLSLAGLMVAVGLAFKLSAVPFHFWCPDVFEGASAEVNAFLSVASKAAALALLVRVVLGIGAVPPDAKPITTATAESRAMFSVADESPKAATAELTRDRANEELGPVRNFAAKLVAFLAIITCTFGNLGAYAQSNIKRLLAYSTIAHAGYMMMAVPPLLALAGSDPALAQRAVSSLLVYVFVYVFMNLGAFAVVAFLRNELRSEEIGDYAGLIRRCPLLVICFASMLFSLVGLPPLAGFIGKFEIFAAIANAWVQQPEPYLLILLVAGGANTALSLFYYLRVVKVMTLDPEPDTRTPFTIRFVPTAFVALLTLPTLALILDWNWVNKLTKAAAEHLL